MTMPLRLLALDPSLTATGWVVVDVATEAIVAGGVIRTSKAKPSERLLAAQDDARRGRHICDGVLKLIEHWRPAVVAQEAVAGSKSARAAAALARAQQACVDAVGDLALEWATQQAVKVAATGRKSASKDDVEAGVRARWTWSTGLLEGLPRGQHEHVYDAGAVAMAVWGRPSVGMLRGFAGGGS